MALGAMMELGRRNIRIPEDVKVTGFGDLEVNVLYRVPLTTVR